MIATVEKNKTHPAVTNNSNGEKVLNIPALASDVHHLQSAVDLWNNIGLYFLFFTAIIAAGYFVASRIAVNKATKLRTAQIALTNAQEEQFKHDLKDKDLKIATLEKQAEEAHLSQTQLEAKIAPRYLPIEQYNILRDELSKYAGTAVDVIAYPGGSPDIIPLSYQIAHMLYEAKWNMIFLKSGASAMFVEGVIVAIRNESDHDALTAAKLLVEGLNANGIVTIFKNSFPDQDKGLFISSEPPDVLNKRKEITRIKILIGIKP